MATNVITRFAPEPSGHMHIGHLKALYINHKFAIDNDGKFILRLDDSNPDTCNSNYTNSIISDVKSLGVDPYKIIHISDYFEQVDQFALQLIKNGQAYVDDLDKDTFTAYRDQKKDSPNRDRNIGDNYNYGVR